MSLGPLAGEILDFWFGPPPHAARATWFRKDAAFDAKIAERFGAAVATALQGGFQDWTTNPRGALARVLLLDQFTRNLFRESPRAFAGDADALATSAAAIDRGDDRTLDRFERWFLYMPFQHAENLVAEERSLVLFRALAAESGEPGNLEWAEKHAVIVRRFGRFPHRNAILGRASTPEEIAFLEQPGSRF
jgi:uncharacterized protein (DUF924 family)